MALAPDPYKSVKSRGLYDAAGTGGKTFEQWSATAGADDAMPSIAPGQVDDSVVSKVNAIIQQDSQLMKAAKTDALKLANRRGLMNSSIAIGAAQDAVVRAATPLASQDAAQDAARNQAARAFEYGMAGQDSAQGWQTGENALDRGLQKDLTLAQIESTEGMEAARRELDLRMQGNQIDAANQQQIKDIASREGLASAERALQELMQTRDIGFRGTQAEADRVLAREQQAKDIAFQSAERNLDRGLQEKIASWNLSLADRNAAAQLLTNMENIYQANYQTIMNNTALDAGSRASFLQSIAHLRDRQINFVEQLMDIDLTW